MGVWRNEGVHAMSGRLRVTMPRSGARDPVVNGFTRVALGVRGYQRFARPLSGSWGGGDMDPIGSNARTINGTIAYTMTEAAGAPDWRNLEGGFSLGNVLAYQYPAGLNGGVRISIGGADMGTRQDLNQSRALKLAIDGAGAVSCWLNGETGVGFVGNGGAAGTAYDYMAGTVNKGEAGVCSFYNVAACAENVLRFANCPANGFVDLYIGAEPKQTVALDAAGAGVFNCTYRLFPLDITYDVQDAAHARRALLRIPQSFGGDVISYRG